MRTQDIVTNSTNPSPPQSYLNDLEACALALDRAVANKRSRSTCLRLWSRVIRTRDLHRCVECHSSEHVNAHHIVRKCVISIAEFDTGNGITLCRSCHHQTHASWNGRPRPNEPLNARGGDDQDTYAHLFHTLTKDAETKGIDIDRYYHLSDPVMNLFKCYQGFSYDDQFEGPHIRQAHTIWQMAPVYWYRKLGCLIIEALEIEDAQESLDHIHKGLSPVIH